MKTKSTRITKRIWRLREDALRPRIVRMLHLGCTCPRIKKALGVNPQKVRDMINTVELQQELSAFQRERLKILDRKMGHLLHAAVLALAKLLRHLIRGLGLMPSRKCPHGPLTADATEPTVLKD
jgi:hypothetical protein